MWRAACARLIGAFALAGVVSAPAFAQNPPDRAAQPPGIPDIPLPDGLSGVPDAPAAPDVPPPIVGDLPSLARPGIEAGLPPIDAGRPPIVGKAEPKRLDLNLSLFDAYDLTRLDASVPGFGDARLQQSTSFTGANASLTYAQLGRNKTLTAATGADLRYYSIAPEVLPMDYFGAGNFSATLSRHVAIRLNGFGSYSPYYTFGNFLTPATSTGIQTPQPDQSIARLDTLSANGSGGLVWSLTRYTSVDLTYGADYADTPAVAYRFHDQSVGGSLHHRTSKYSEFHVGYAYRRMDNGLLGALPFVANDINAGFSYHRPLSFSRRTVAGFNVGSTLVSQGGAQYFTLTGDGSISYQMSRTWIAALFVTRDVSMFGGALVPFASTVFSGSIGGLFTRHVSFDASGSYSHGSSALGVSNGYNALNGSSSLHFTLSRYLPMYVQYVYYFYRFDEAIGLAPAFPVTTNRSGVRAGLSYSLPIIGQRVPRT